ncbi:hypothetical protein ACFWFI_01125 [Streptomyces sp. NPDC060209]|uniref:hypothetical protein n=1 Tax=Streptomyces sp. NPDC060209 TaxID=3347073 RepID=UPI0036587954
MAEAEPGTLCVLPKARAPYDTASASPYRQPTLPVGAFVQPAAVSYFPSFPRNG